jgi:hypothetical protein
MSGKRFLFKSAAATLTELPEEKKKAVAAHESFE